MTSRRAACSCAEFWSADGDGWKQKFPSDCLRRIESVYPFRRKAVPSGGATVISM